MWTSIQLAPNVSYNGFECVELRRPLACRSTSDSTRLDVTIHLRRWVLPPGLSKMRGCQCRLHGLPFIGSHLLNLVRASGFEPPTPRIRNECATRLRYALTDKKLVGATGLEPARPFRRWFPKPEGFHLPAYAPIVKNVSRGSAFSLVCWEFHNSQSPDAVQRVGRSLIARELRPRACWVACTVGNPEMVASCSWEDSILVAVATHK